MRFMASTGINSPFSPLHTQENFDTYYMTMRLQDRVCNLNRLILAESCTIRVEVSASFVTFEPCGSHAMHMKVDTTVSGLSHWVDRTVPRKSVSRPIAIALRRLLYLFDINLE